MSVVMAPDTDLPVYVTAPAIIGISGYNFQIVGVTGTLKDLRISIFDIGDVNQSAGAIIRWEAYILRAPFTGALLTTGVRVDVAYDVPAPQRVSDSGILSFPVVASDLIAIRCTTIVHKGPNRVLGSISVEP